MNEDSRARKEIGRRRRIVAPDDLSEAAIRRELRLDALQHPATLLPLSISAMAVIFILVLSPVFGWLWALVALVVSCIAAVASFIWRYLIHYSREYESRIESMLDLQDIHQAEEQRAEMKELHEALLTGFLNAESVEGRELLRDLNSEHERLRSALRDQAETDPLAMPHAVVLANETYRRGMSVLSDALRLLEATPLHDIHRLKQEVTGLCREIEEPGPERLESERINIKWDTLVSIRERIDMLDRVQLRVDRLLFQVRRCDGALQHARVELIAIRTGTSETQVDSVVSALQATVNQVKEVQDELGRHGF